jgi:hypothetical protein
MPIDIREQASENLRFIRGAMERAERVSAVSGFGLMVMGAIALVAMPLASGAPGVTQDVREMLMVWVGAAVPAALGGGAASWLKARNSGLLPLGDSGRRLLLCLLPALAVGALLSVVLWNTESIGALPAFWMLLYGTGVVAAGTYAAAPIIRMGAGFLVAGFLGLTLPSEWSNVLLGATFGGLHVYFGYVVYRDHGG